MYHIVLFGTLTVEVVHDSWIEEILHNEKVKVAFPPKSLYSSIRKFLRGKVAPSSTWCSYEVDILHSEENYDNITTKCNKFVDTGSLSSDQGGKRRRTTVVRYGYDDDTDAEITTSDSEKKSLRAKRKKKMKRSNAIIGEENFPSAPTTSLGDSNESATGNAKSSYSHTGPNMTKTNLPEWERKLNPSDAIIGEESTTSAPTTSVKDPNKSTTSDSNESYSHTRPNLIETNVSERKGKPNPCDTAIEDEYFLFAPTTSSGDPNESTTSDSNESYSHNGPNLTESNLSHGGELKCHCHCEHQLNWMKETIRIVLRIEDFIRNTYRSPGMHKDHTSDEVSQSNLQFPKTTEEITTFFSFLKNDQSKRLEAVRVVSRETSSKLKKSIERIILRIAPSSAWTAFSKNGQRGKLSAVDLGLPDFLIECLHYRKCNRLDTTEKIEGFMKLVGEILKRMPQIQKRRSHLLEQIVSNHATTRCAREEE